jgi:hypothetical protein
MAECDLQPSTAQLRQLSKILLDEIRGNLATRGITLKGFPLLETMYQPKEWHEAYAILASGGAVIAGLLIVATAVRANQILSSLHWRLRARNSTLSMITIMIGSNLVLLPQDVIVLGVELIVFNLTSACLLPGPVIFNELRKHEGLSIRVPVLAAFFYLLAAAGGASLIVHWGGGLYLPMAAYSAYLLSAVATAFALLMPHRKAR